ncbi:MAG: DinB family protein [Bryobacteraceae bacterium]
MSEIEPWLRGPLADVHLLVAPTLHAFTQAGEDIQRWTEGLTAAQIWSRPYNLAPVGFHLRHIAGSVDRLTTYLRGQQLAPEQLEALRHEMDPGAERIDLLSAVADALAKSAETIRNLDVNLLTDPRTVGRKQLPTTIMGLVVHLAEHTQRHVGELIVTAKLARAI